MIDTLQYDEIELLRRENEKLRKAVGRLSQEVVPKTHYDRLLREKNRLHEMLLQEMKRP